MSGGWEIRRGKIWRITAVFAVSGALALSGCASNTDTSEPTEETTAATAEKVDAIANTVPEGIKSTGRLVVGVNVPYTPNEFKDPSGKIVGFDVDLMNAIASTLGLTADYRESDFEKIIPSIQGGTFNVGMSSFTDTKEREASVDFVTYFSAGTMWAQRAGETVDPNDACGKKVAVQTTTVQETKELPTKSEACVAAGKPPIEIVKFDGQDAATNAVVLRAGRRHVRRPARDRVGHHAEQGQARASRRDVRLRAVRLAGRQRFAVGAVPAAGARAPHRDRRLRADRQELGR